MPLFARRTRPETTGYSVIDEHAVVHGEITSQGTIRIDGRIDGQLHRADTLIVGRTGSIAGDIEAREVVVAGAVEGNILAEMRVEIQPTGSVRGDITASAMHLAEGGAVTGHVAIASREAAAPDIPRIEAARHRTPALPG